MSQQYYYLVSSLPLVQLGERPTLSSEQFLEMCVGEVSEEELATLREMELVPRGGEGGSVVESAWSEWDTCIRNELVRHRAGELGVDVEGHMRDENDVFPTDRKQLEEVLAMGDPAARERALDDLRWRRLDDLETGHPFDFGALVLFRLRLLLAEKWAEQDRERGVRNLGRLIEDGLQQAGERRIAGEKQAV
ncbi:MAG: DUF2764 family protein [Lentisphaeria bacterium]|nr:DUF2764 family protein [Lentisphaeria bacterium]